MLNCIKYFSYILGVEPFWFVLVIVLLFILLLVKCLYPWQPKWKTKETKDKDGSIVIKYYRLKE